MIDSAAHSSSLGRVGRSRVRRSPWPAWPPLPGRRRWLAALAAFVVAPPATATDVFRDVVRPFLTDHCGACHGVDATEGGVSFAGIDDAFTVKGDGDAKTLDTWERAYEQLSLDQMPPADEPRPDPHVTLQVLDWIRTGLTRAGRPPANKLALPGHGNFVPHENLFGRPATSPSFGPPRYWRIRPAAYDVRMNRVVKGGYTPPFTLSSGPGFADYSTLFAIDAPSLELLLANAKAVAERLVPAAARQPGGDGKPAGPEPLRRLVAADDAVPTDAEIQAAIRWCHHNILLRETEADELARLTTFVRDGIERVGAIRAARGLVMAVLLSPEFIYRSQVGSGEPDAYGRVRVTPRETAYAIAYALTDQPPDRTLLDAAARGRLSGTDDVHREVVRLLEDPAVSHGRTLGFFREYFGYPRAIDVFKDKALNAFHNPQGLVRDADRLVEHVLAADRDVLATLLTTRQAFFEGHEGGKHKNHLAYGLPPDWKQTRKDEAVELPADQRAGILTQPAWLVAHSGNFDNDPIRRGKWVRERLLGGTVPDLPITVNAQVPEDPAKTLRERLTVTREAECWKCHQRMNPLGMPFERYDHFGRWRTQELGRPVDTSGSIDASGVSALDGPVEQPVEMMRRLAGSERVRQVFVRHAFRYWMGRNETLDDAATLQAADRAYVESAGSMKALIAALLASDSFLFVKPVAALVAPEPTP